MSDTTEDTNTTPAALRERRAELQLVIDNLEMRRTTYVERLEELDLAIELLARGGKRKPGPKPGKMRVVETPLASLGDALRASIDKLPPPPNDAA